ncbi:ead/Ea22-like family protein [Serratia marcescens]|nr:ead/Ea22-like family protein [Serratia marcescens]
MDKFSELKAAAMAATPGRIGDRIDGSGSIKYECTGYDGSLVLRTNHKDMEYGFVGDNADADELFFRLCVPDVVLELLAELAEKNERIGELEAEVSIWESAATKHLERAEEAEKRLAMPVRLTDAVDYSDLDATSKDREVIEAIAECKGWNANRLEQAALLKKQGFKVEGEQ